MVKCKGFGVIRSCLVMVLWFSANGFGVIRLRLVMVLWLSGLDAAYHVLLTRNVQNYQRNIVQHHRNLQSSFPSLSTFPTSKLRALTFMRARLMKDSILRKTGTLSLFFKV